MENDTIINIQNVDILGNISPINHSDQLYNDSINVSDSNVDLVTGISDLNHIEISSFNDFSDLDIDTNNQDLTIKKKDILNNLKIDESNIDLFKIKHQIIFISDNNIKPFNIELFNNITTALKSEENKNKSPSSKLIIISNIIYQTGLQFNCFNSNYFNNKDKKYKNFLYSSIINNIFESNNSKIRPKAPLNDIIEFYTKLFKSEENNDLSSLLKTSKHDYINNPPAMNINDYLNYIHNKKNFYPDEFGLSFNLLKCCTSINEIIVSLINEIIGSDYLKIKNYLNELMKARIILEKKKSKINIETNDIKDYRPIVSIPIFGKIIDSFFSIQIKKYVCDNPTIFNFDFQKYNTIKKINSISGVMNNCITTNYIYQNVDNSFLLFIDLENAFSNVNHKKLFQILKINEYPDFIINYFISFYQNATFSIGNDNNNFFINKGIFQGIPSSDILFCIYIDNYFKNINTISLKHGIKSNAMIKDIYIRSFMDDIVIFFNDKYDIELFSKSVVKINRMYDINFNYSKCFYITNPKSNLFDNFILNIDNNIINKIHHIQNIKYLGGFICHQYNLIDFLEENIIKLYFDKISNFHDFEISNPILKFKIFITVCIIKINLQLKKYFITDKNIYQNLAKTLIKYAFDLIDDKYLFILLNHNISENIFFNNGQNFLFNNLCFLFEFINIKAIYITNSKDQFVDLSLYNNFDNLNNTNFLNNIHECKNFLKHIIVPIKNSQQFFDDIYNH